VKEFEELLLEFCEPVSLVAVLLSVVGRNIGGFGDTSKFQKVLLRQ